MRSFTDIVTDENVKKIMQQNIVEQSNRSMVFANHVLPSLPSKRAPRSLRVRMRLWWSSFRFRLGCWVAGVNLDELEDR